jgi:hypothetical protein
MMMCFYLSHIALAFFTWNMVTSLTYLTPAVPSMRPSEWPANRPHGDAVPIMDEEDYKVLGRGRTEAVAAFYENNRRRRDFGLRIVLSKVFAGILMSIMILQDSCH